MLIEENISILHSFSYRCIDGEITRVSIPLTGRSIIFPFRRANTKRPPIPIYQPTTRDAQYKNNRVSSAKLLSVGENRPSPWDEKSSLSLSSRVHLTYYYIETPNTVENELTRVKLRVTGR